MGWTAGKPDAYWRLLAEQAAHDSAQTMLADALETWKGLGRDIDRLRELVDMRADKVSVLAAEVLDALQEVEGKQ